MLTKKDSRSKDVIVLSKCYDRLVFQKWNNAGGFPSPAQLIDLSDLDSRYQRLLMNWANDELFGSLSRNKRKLTGYGTITEQDDEKILKEVWIDIRVEGWYLFIWRYNYGN